MAKSVKKYIEENEARFLEEWFSLICIPSVSADRHVRQIWWLVPNVGSICCWRPERMKLG